MNGFDSNIAGKLQKLDKVKEACNFLLRISDSLEEDNLGAASFYLLHAILFDTKVDIIDGVDEDQHIGPLFKLLIENCQSEQMWLLEYFTVNS